MTMMTVRAIGARPWAAAAGLVLLIAVLSLSLGRVADHRGVLTTLLSEESPTALAVDSRTGRAFVATSGPGGRGSVLVLDIATGRSVRSAILLAAPRALAVDERTGHVFVATAGAAVVMLDATTGSVRRTIGMHDSPFALAVDARAARAFILSFDASDPPHGGMRVSVLDTQRGTLVHRVAVGQLPGLLALDRRAHRVLLTSPGYRAAGTLFVLDARSGALLHSRRLDGYATGVAVDEWHGRAYLFSGDARRLDVLDTRSGAVLRTLPLGAPPLAVAVDAATARSSSNSPRTPGCMCWSPARDGSCGLGRARTPGPAGESRCPGPP